jgi:hypothetical protein
MITKQDILEATEETLPRLAGEVLQPEKNKHIPGNRSHGQTFCSKCDLKLWTWAVPRMQYTHHWERPCERANPIPLTWDNAMKFRDWAVEKYGDCFYDEMYNVYTHDNFCGCFNEWLVGYAKPEHYLKAAAICKLNSEEGI